MGGSTGGSGADPDWMRRVKLRAAMANLHPGVATARLSSQRHRWSQAGFAKVAL